MASCRVRGSPRASLIVIGLGMSLAACLQLLGARPAHASSRGIAALEFTDVWCGGNGSVTALHDVNALPLGEGASFTAGRTVTIPVAVDARNLVTASLSCTYHWFWVRWTQRVDVVRHVDVSYSGQRVRL